MSYRNFAGWLLLYTRWILRVYKYPFVILLHP